LADPTDSFVSATPDDCGPGIDIARSYSKQSREHPGDFLFSNNRPQGALFTVVLPPYPN